MPIQILAVGRLKEEFWTAAEAEYRKRLRRYADVKVTEVKDDAALVSALPAKGSVIALDERGELLSSEELARQVLARLAQPVFVVGGAEGLPEAVRTRAARLVAFGRITLPHRLARIVLLEQIYRGFTILRGEPYHK